jgi:hypothetical protein
MIFRNLKDRVVDDDVIIGVSGLVSSSCLGLGLCVVYVFVRVCESVT